MSTSFQQSYSNFVKNSERYMLGNYDNNSPDINTDNLIINIETLSSIDGVIKVLEVIEYWKPYEPYPNEVNIFFIELFRHKNNRNNILSYLENKNNKTETEKYYYKLLAYCYINSLIGKYISNIELINYVLDNNILISFSPNISINSLLVGTSEYGYLEVVKYLINLGADWRTENYYAMRIATIKGYSELVKYLKSLM